jgi:hypothetical protein
MFILPDKQGHKINAVADVIEGYPSELKQTSEQEFPDLMKHNANSKEPIGGSVCALSREKGACFEPLYRV